MSDFRRDIDFLNDIEDAIRHVLEYIGGMTWDGYLFDRKTQDAVIRNLEVMGEAVKKLSAEERQNYAEIPWQEIAGTRDRLTHHYFGINQEIAWEIVSKDLSNLHPRIEQIIRDLPRAE